MAFTLVHTWSFGEKLTSAQQNQLAVDVSNALDKSVAGDQIAGTVSFVGSGTIDANTSGAIEASAIEAIFASVANGIISAVPDGISTQVAGGISGAIAGAIVPTIAGGISDGGVAGGISATVANGIASNAAGGITALVAGGITDGVANGITITQQHGLRSNTGGGNGIRLSGGSEWIDLQVTRTKKRFIPLSFPSGISSPPAIGTGWSMSGGLLLGAATSSVLQVQLNGMLSGDVNGATLTRVDLVFAVGQAHSGVPNPLPLMDIRRMSLNSGTAGGYVSSLYSGGIQSMGTGTGLWTVPTTGVLWFASGNNQNYSTVPNQNNVIDCTQYGYQLTLADENTTNQQTGNVFYGLLLWFSAIGNTEPG